MRKSGVDLRPARALVKQLEAAAKNAPAEFKRVIGTAKRIAKVEVARAATKVYTASTRRITDGLSAGKSTQLSFEIIGTGSTLTAASYGGRQVKKGYRYQVMRGGTVKTERAGFVPRGLKAPFRRVGKARTPIETIRGPSVADMMNNPKVALPAGEVIGTRIETDLQRRLDRLVK